jgi:hypothetical protein
MVHTRKQKQQRMEPDHLTHFMERSEQHMKEVMEVLAALNQKYNRLSVSMQRMEAESIEGCANGGVPPPPPPHHALDFNSGTGNHH